MKKIIFTLLAIVLLSLNMNAQTIGIMVQSDVDLYAGAEETGGDPSNGASGETVTYRIIDIDGKIYAKTTTSMATLSETFGSQIREVKEDASVGQYWLDHMDSYVTNRWTNDGFAYDDQNSDGMVSLFLMHVLPGDWPWDMYFTVPFDYTIGQVQPEDPTDTEAPTLYEVYVDGSDLVFDCDESNCFFYFVDNTGEIKVTFENRYNLSSLAGVSSLTAYAVDFSGNKSAEATYSFGTTVGSMKIDNAQLYNAEGEYANGSSPVTGYTLTTRIVDVNGIVYAKTDLNNGSFDSNAYGCQLRNNAGEGSITQHWLSNGNEGQSTRWNRKTDEWDGNVMNFAIGSLMYPDENVTELYSLCLIDGIEGACATQTLEYAVGVANSADGSDVTAPVITNVSHTIVGESTIITVSATDADEVFYLAESEEDGLIVSLLPEFEVSSFAASVDITAYDYSGNVSSVETYDFTNYVPTGFSSKKYTLPVTVIATDGGIRVITEEDGDIDVYSITGALVYKAPIKAGETFIPLHKGFYIVNSTKVIVK